MTKFNRWQVSARDAYANGAFNWCLDMDDVNTAGDTLFRFIMVELSDKEGCTDQEEAERRMNSAARDIDDVLGAIDQQETTQ